MGDIDVPVVTHLWFSLMLLPARVAKSTFRGSETDPPGDDKCEYFVIRDKIDLLGIEYVAISLYV